MSVKIKPFISTAECIAWQVKRDTILLGVIYQDDLSKEEYRASIVGYKDAIGVFGSVDEAAEAIEAAYDKIDEEVEKA